ncbi:MAG: FAD-binding oxidoreductase, partial [bacterium]
MTTDLVAQLQSAVSRVVTPDDPGYDTARTVVAAQVDRRPTAIVQPVDDAEVGRVVTLAREAGVPLAVRSGGHSLAGHGVVDDGIVLDLGAMRGLDIDPASRTAWAEAGVTTGAYTKAAGEHALATGFGDTGTVGVSGITLAGGAGFLARKHGLAIDNLLAADIVTADGESRRIDADNHPDLFWAIRGGGGNFGVVTRMQFRLHDVREFVGGMLLLPATPEVVAGFATAANAAPDELTTIAMVMTAPPLPFIPAEHHGKTVVLGLMGYAGPAADAERALAPFRTLATPLADMVQP